MLNVGAALRGWNNQDKFIRDQERDRLVMEQARFNLAEGRKAANRYDAAYEADANNRALQELQDNEALRHKQKMVDLEQKGYLNDLTRLAEGKPLKPERMRELWSNVYDTTVPQGFTYEPGSGVSVGNVRFTEQDLARDMYTRLMTTNERIGKQRGELERQSATGLFIHEGRPVSMSVGEAERMGLVPFEQAETLKDLAANTEGQILVGPNLDIVGAYNPALGQWVDNNQRPIKDVSKYRVTTPGALAEHIRGMHVQSGLGFEPLDAKAILDISEKMAEPYKELNELGTSTPTALSRTVEEMGRHLLSKYRNVIPAEDMQSFIVSATKDILTHNPRYKAQRWKDPGLDASARLREENLYMREIQERVELALQYMISSKDPKEKKEKVARVLRDETVPGTISDNPNTAGGDDSAFITPLSSAMKRMESPQLSRSDNKGPSQTEIFLREFDKNFPEIMKEAKRLQAERKK